jgi:hypothetical protein
MKNSLGAKELSVFAAALIGVLAFLYPIPGTGAYRNVCFLLILVLIIATAILGAREGESGWRELSFPWKNSCGTIFLALSGWMLFRILLAENPLVRAAEWAEEWLIGGVLLCFITFVVTSQVLRNRGSVSVITIVFISLMCHVVWTLAYQIQLGLSGAHWLGLTPFAARDFASTIVGYAFALSFVDRLSRSVKAPSLIIIPDRLSKLCFALCLLLIVTLNTRNGVLTILAVTFFLFAAALLNSNWKFSDLAENSFVLRVVVVCISLVFATIVFDSRWLHFFDTLGVTLNNQATIEVSELSGSRGVESSLALRLNYFRLGMAALIDYPLGVGYARDAFGELMSRQGAGEHLVSSHSGLLDFTLANGLPALALWIFFSVMIVKGSLDLAKNGNMSAFFLISVWSTFFIRTLLDGHFSGWRLKLFAIIVGCLTAAILARSRTTTTPSG